MSQKIGLEIGIPTGVIGIQQAANSLRSYVLGIGQRAGYSTYLASPEREENQSTENIRPIYAVPIHAGPVVLLGRGKEGPLLDASAEH